MFGADEATDYMGGIFNTFGFNVVSSAKTTFSTETEKEKKTNQKQIDEAFDTLITRIKGGKKNKPTTRQIIHFNIFKSVSELYPEHFKADYEYHKDKTDYYLDGANINFIKNMMIKRTVKSMMSKIE